MKPGVLGSTAEVTVYVTPAMAAILEEHLVHPVYSTFWLAYHAEVAARRAIEPFFEEGENAVGAELWLRHEAMAPIGAQVVVRAEVTEHEGNRIWCRIEARLGERCIATGRQLQIVLPHEKLQQRVHHAYAQAGLPPPSPHPNVRISGVGSQCV
jgi:predicted thioesterase